MVPAKVAEKASLDTVTTVTSRLVDLPPFSSRSIDVDHDTIDRAPGHALVIGFMLAVTARRIHHDAATIVIHLVVEDMKTKMKTKNMVLVGAVATAQVLGTSVPTAPPSRHQEALQRLLPVLTTEDAPALALTKHVTNVRVLEPLRRTILVNGLVHEVARLLDLVIIITRRVARPTIISVGLTAGHPHLDGNCQLADALRRLIMRRIPRNLFYLRNMLSHPALKMFFYGHKTGPSRVKLPLCPRYHC